MKTKIFFAAVAIIFSINASMANQSESTLTFWNAMGEKLVQPIMMDEETETLPVELRCEYKNVRNSNIFRIFDLTEFTKPEAEEELPYYLRNDYHSAI
jgi:hypothetical protein